MWLWLSWVFIITTINSCDLNCFFFIYIHMYNIVTLVSVLLLNIFPYPLLYLYLCYLWQNCGRCGEVSDTDLCVFLYTNICMGVLCVLQGKFSDRIVVHTCFCPCFWNFSSSLFPFEPYSHTRQIVIQYILNIIPEHAILLFYIGFFYMYR